MGHPSNLTKWQVNYGRGCSTSVWGVSEFGTENGKPSGAILARAARWCCCVAFAPSYPFSKLLRAELILINELEHDKRIGEERRGERGGEEREGEERSGEESRAPPPPFPRATEPAADARPADSAQPQAPKQGTERRGEERRGEARRGEERRGEERPDPEAGAKTVASAPSCVAALARAGTARPAASARQNGSYLPRPKAPIVNPVSH